MDCPNGFWCMQFKDWLNVVILVSPPLQLLWVLSSLFD
jgi:hypothetical protein